MHICPKVRMLSHFGFYSLVISLPVTMSSGKTVLITGATRGIGLALVGRYVQDGWHVIATARNVDKADSLKALSPSKIVQLDVSDEHSIASAAETLKGEPIDLLINNAGILEEGTLQTSTKESLMRQFEINAVAPFLVTRAFIANLRLASALKSEAKVVSVSSQLGSITLNADGPYAGGLYGYRASKAALNMINSSLVIDLKADNIIVVVLDPGYVNTEINNHAGVVEPSDSAAGMSSVIAGLTMADSGKFFDYTGVDTPW